MGLVVVVQIDVCSLSFLVKFTKAAPQLPMEELVSLSKEMVAALTTCCTLSDEFACVDNLVSMVYVPDYAVVYSNLRFLKVRYNYIIAPHSLLNS